MSKYAGTKTEANLRAAFAGESQARNQYTFFASVAKKEGYEQMAALFLKTAENEKEHAKLWLKELAGIGDTKANLAAAAAGEADVLLMKRTDASALGTMTHYPLRYELVSTIYSVI